MPRATRAELPQFGTLPRSLRVAMEGVTLHLLEWGDPEGRPVLLVHGMRGHARWFTPVGPALAQRYRALSLDLRGHGESSHSPPYGPHTYADDVVALIDALSLDGLILVGHSMGGGVTVRAAARLGDRLSALVLVDSNFIGGPPPEAERARRERLAARGEREPRELSVFGSWEQARSRFALRPGGTVASGELLDHLAHHALRELPEGGYVWRFDPQLPSFPRGRFEPPDPSRITCPVGLIFGAESPIRQRIDLDTLRGGFTSARFTELEVIPCAHHHVFLDKPAEFNRALLEFLARV